MACRTGRRTGRAAALATLALCAALAVPAAASTRDRAAPPVPLHAAVGDTLDRGEARLWGLFPDVPDLDWAVFQAAPTGGFIARLRLAGPDGPRIRERNVPRAEWMSWRDSLDRGEPVAAAGAPPAPTGTAVWPEAPLPGAGTAPPPLPAPPDTTVPIAAARWLTLVDVGYKHSTTRFGDYFTDMLALGVAVGRPLSDWFVPTLGLRVGVGDLVDDFEAITGNGKSAHYALELGALLRAPLSGRTDVCLGLAGGYYMRSLRWGGTYYYSYLDVYESGSLVRELSDWGGSARIGLQWRLGARGAKPKLLDLSIRYETCGAEASLLENPDTGAVFTAEDRDVWIGVSLGLVVGI